MKNPTVDDFTHMWSKVDKSKLVQYKLKVELSQDIIDGVQGVGGATAVG